MPVLDQSLQSVQALGVGGFGNPQLQVTSLGIFFIEMVKDSLDVSLSVQLRIVPEAELDGATKDGVCVNQPVCLCHYLAVDAPWFVVGRCSVVFNGLCHCLNLLVREPFPQVGILSDYSTGNNVVCLAVFLQSQVMVGGNGINHAGIDIIERQDVHALPDDRTNMVFLMCFVESGIPWDYFPFDEGFK